MRCVPRGKTRDSRMWYINPAHSNSRPRHTQLTTNRNNFRDTHPHQHILLKIPIRFWPYFSLYSSTVRFWDNIKADFMPCHSTGGQSPVSHYGCSGSLRGQSMWYLWWTRWHWDGLSRVYSVVSCQYHITILPYLVVYHLGNG